MLVAMMHEMAPPVALEGQPQSQRECGEEAVEGGPACRVPVDDLVLQRGMPDDQAGPGRHEEPDRHACMEEGERPPPAVDQRREENRRPFDGGADGALRLLRDPHLVEPQPCGSVKSTPPNP